MKERSEPYPSVGLPAAIALAGVVIIGLIHLPASFAPGVLTWGFDYWSEFSVAVRLALAGLLLILAIPAVARFIDRMVQRAAPRRIIAGIALLILVSLFIVFRAQGYAYGDGYSLISNLRSSELPQFHGQLYLQPLDLIVHWFIARYIVDPLGLPLSLSYTLIGALAGVASLWAIWRIARRLASSRSESMLIVAAACTSSVIVFWFGHVESYTLANAALLWCLAFALDANDNPHAIWWAWAACLVGIACHTLVVVAVPILAWCHWSRTRTSHVQDGPNRSLLFFGLGFVICGIGTFAFNRLVHPVFVPILPTADSAYSAFSLHHLADVANLILFLAPLTPLALVGIVGRQSQDEPPRHHTHAIVAVFSAVTFYFAFWVDPLLGAFRDWDLLAVFGIPTSIWAASVVIRRYDLNKMRSWLWVPVAGLAITHAGAFVATVQNETAVAMRIDRLVREDIHYSGDFYDGTRLAPWARILDRVFQRYDLEREHLRRWTEIDPSNGVAWASLANAHLRLRDGDRALACFEKAWSLDPDNDAFGYCAGLLHLKKGDSLAAMKAMDSVVVLSDTTYIARTILGSLYLEYEQYGRADSILRDARRLNPNLPDAYLHLARLRERQGQFKDALTILDEARANGVDSAELRALWQRIQRRMTEDERGAGP